MKDELTVNSELKWIEFINWAREIFEKDHCVVFKANTGKQRTQTQNASLHLYCEHLAKTLNDAGLDMKKVMKPEADIPWTKDTVKENLWRPIQEAVIQKESTVDAHRDEYGQVYEVLNRHLAQKFGVSVPWPRKQEAEAA